MFKRMVTLCMVLCMLIACIPTQALQREIGNKSYTVDEMIKESDSFWNSISPKENQLKTQKTNPESYMNAAYELVASQKNVKEIVWEDEDTFTFTLSKGVMCAYDYEQRMIDLECEKAEPYGETLVYDYSDKAHTTHNKQVVFFGAYYGIQSTFDQYSKKTDMQTVTNKINGTLTMILGYDATPAALRTYMQLDDLAFFCVHGHGEVVNNTSYIKCQGSTGLTSDDLNNKHAVSFGSGIYGVDGYYMTDNCTAQIDDCFIWFGSCESMMTDKLGTPLIQSGAAVVLGFSQSVTVVYEHYSWGYFWRQMINGATVAQAALTMKNTQYPTISGITPSVPVNCDPYYSLHAYPVFMSKTDSYPANPNSVQNVTSTWKFYNTAPEYEVTFKDWDGTVLDVQSVYENESAVAPKAPVREGYTFIGWSGSLDNITADTEFTAQYIQGEPKLEVVSKTAVAGGSAAIKIVGKDMNGISELSLKVNYDSSVLEFIGASNGSVFSNFVMEGDSIYWSGSCLKSEDDVVGILVFNIKENAAEGRQAAVSLSNVKITIGGIIVELENTGEAGTITVVDFILGDIDRNGEINTVDALCLLRYLANWNITIDMNAADINGTGDVNMVDALLFLRYLAGDNSAGYFNE